MNDIKMVGNIQLLGSIYDVEFVDTGEGSVGPLLFGDSMSCHAIRMPPGYYPPHPHDFDLTIMVLEGEVDLIQGEHRGTMRQFALMMVKEGEEHGWEVKGPGDCVIYVMVAPKQWTRDEFYARARRDAAEGAK